LVKDSHPHLSTISHCSEETVSKTYTRFAGDVYKMKIVGFNDSVRNMKTILPLDRELA